MRVAEPEQTADHQEAEHQHQNEERAGGEELAQDDGALPDRRRQKKLHRPGAVLLCKAPHRDEGQEEECHGAKRAHETPQQILVHVGRRGFLAGRKHLFAQVGVEREIVAQQRHEKQSDDDQEHRRRDVRRGQREVGAQRNSRV